LFPDIQFSTSTRERARERESRSEIPFKYYSPIFQAVKGHYVSRARRVTYRFTKSDLSETKVPLIPSSIVFESCPISLRVRLVDPLRHRVNPVIASSFPLRTNDSYINHADRQPSVSMLFIIAMMCTRTSVHLTHARVVSTFDPDKGKSMRFLSRVHSRGALPTALNLMELECAKMRRRARSSGRSAGRGIFRRSGRFESRR